MYYLSTLFIVVFLVVACSNVNLYENKKDDSSPVAWDKDPNFDPDGSDSLERSDTGYDNDVKNTTNKKPKKKTQSSKKSSTSSKTATTTVYNSKTSKKKSSKKNVEKTDKNKPAENLPLPPAGNRFDILKTVAVNDVESADTDYFEEKLQQLTGVLPVEINGQEVTLGPRNIAENKALARTFLQQEYEDIGFEVTLHDYGSGVNLIAEREGIYKDKVIIVAAHYDTVATVGADDDGTGVIGALTLANELKNIDLMYTLRIIAFDEEELGLIGSTAYVNQLTNDNKLEDVIGVFVIEMIGYDANDDKAYHIVDCIQDPATPTANSNLLSLLILESSSLRNDGFQRSNACTDRSDHTPFWNVNVPAVVISQDFFGGDSNPCYHNECDQMDMINLDYAGKMVDLLTTTILNIVEE